MTTKRLQTVIGLVIALITLSLDQWTKLLITSTFDGYDASAISLTPFFNLVLVWNHGISFGMLASHNQPLVLCVLSALIVLVLLGWMWRSPAPMVSNALGCVIGGAVGNVADRVRLGAVVDFLDFHAGNLHWPAFNVADSAIFIGVVLLCIHSMFIEPKKLK